jgi:hypothetical protein
MVGMCDDGTLGWDAARTAEALEMPEERVERWQQHYRDVREIVDAPTAAEGFRRGVRLSSRRAVGEGLGDKASMERLVTQICYRAADLGFRLEAELCCWQALSTSACMPREEKL